MHEYVKNEWEKVLSGLAQTLNPYLIGGSQISRHGNWHLLQRNYAPPPLFEPRLNRYLVHDELKPSPYAHELYRDLQHLLDFTF